MRSAQGPGGAGGLKGPEERLQTATPSTSGVVGRNIYSKHQGKIPTVWRAFHTNWRWGPAWPGRGQGAATALQAHTSGATALLDTSSQSVTCMPPSGCWKQHVWQESALKMGGGLTCLILWGLGTMVPSHLGSKCRAGTQTCPGGHSGKFHINLVDRNSFSHLPLPDASWPTSHLGSPAWNLHKAVVAVPEHTPSRPPSLTVPMTCTGWDCHGFGPRSFLY